MMFHVVAMALGTQLVLAADRVPAFDPAGGCRSVAEISGLQGRTSGNCLDDERRAHEVLEKSYGQFSAADKAHCEVLQKTGGQPSYVELLSCLEMARDARRMATERGKDGLGMVNETRPARSGAPKP